MFESNNRTLCIKLMLLAGTLASSMLLSSARAQSTAPPATPAAAPAPYRNQLHRFPRRAGLYYGLVWGVDSLSLKYTESGEIIRFSYRVVDADKAKTLNDKKAEPALISTEKGVKLVVPSLEQVGPLRQSSTPIAGKSYWMAFSNSGRLLRPGDRVNIEIGQFRAEGLVVE